jgi:hypothetical protein
MTEAVRRAADTIFFGGTIRWQLYCRDLVARGFEPARWDMEHY